MIILNTERREQLSIEQGSAALLAALLRKHPAKVDGLQRLAISKAGKR